MIKLRPSAVSKCWRKQLGHYLLLAMLSLALTACATDNRGGVAHPAPDWHEQNKSVLANDITVLTNRLTELGGGINPTEARRVAETAVIYSRELADRYRVVKPAVWHNILVRLGFRDRGLCYHWTTDLMRKLQALELKSLELFWGVAYRGSELREHNSVVIAARSKAFENGIVLDPWRYSGDLYWAPVDQDRYPWRQLPRNMWF